MAQTKVVQVKRHQPSYSGDYAQNGGSGSPGGGAGWRLDRLLAVISAGSERMDPRFLLPQRSRIPDRSE